MGQTTETEPIQNHILPFGKSCFGCGQQNAHGLRIQSRWEGDEVVCRWTPEPWHVAGPDFINGGVIATLIDCHGACTALAEVARAEGWELGERAAPVYVTASLHVDYLKPVPAGTAVVLRARAKEIAGRKVHVSCNLAVEGVECVRGEVWMVRI